MNGKLLDSENVVELAASEKFAAIREVIFRAPTFRDLADINLFEKSVMERESIGSTGLGHGVAFAHGKLPEVPHMKVALGISRQGIDFQSVDGSPVHLLFVVATRPDMHIDYLECLSTLARMARSDGFREDILSCCREEDVEYKLSENFLRIRGCVETA
jgi:PTS system nitrogen regulatory IIA component